MTTKPLMVIRESIYVPHDHIDPDLVSEEYTKYIYDDKICNRCDNKSLRHNYICDQCAIGGFTQVIHMSSNANIGGQGWVKLPIGDRHKMLTLFGIDARKYDVLDKRSCNHFQYDIVFKGALRDYQKESTTELMTKMYGLLEAPPRSGKTISGIFMAVKLGYRCIIIANQHDFLKGFEEHVEQYTNLPELEEQTGKRLYGFPKKDTDFDELQICFCTYQQFIKGKTGLARLNRVNKNFGFLLVDEVHRGNSTEFSKCLSRLAQKVKIGLTATPERKDGREFLVESLIGPVQHVVNIPMLVPTMYLHATGVCPVQQYTLWTFAMQFLAKSVVRNDMIVRFALRDIKNGKSIVIPVSFKDHVNYLVDEINMRAGKQVAEPFMGGGGKKNKVHREGVIARCRTGETRVIVGIRSLLQLGLNVERWSALYVVMPISNQPNWKQESSRILTPMKGKKPIIRFFVDLGMGQSTGCFRNTYRHSKEFGYVLSKKSKSKIGKFMAGKHKETHEDDDLQTHRSSDTTTKPTTKTKLFGNR